MSAQKNLELAQAFLGKLGQGDAEGVAALFAEDAEWDIAGDVGALPWLGKKRGRAAVVDFIHDSANLIERLKLEVHDILAGEQRAVILGELASRYKPNGKVMETAFAVVLQISDNQITHYRMFEDSFAVSQATRAA
ncbi:nuclear transport factor 2 family protein [Burkholderia gladioli]|uniref:nuclear transport factor 2 family protein n=1 Tax=Burkholderia gladioli TaxID=28095 RepID=UPI00163FCB8B|nr:nuclear transport factor 2 family protein [Burkholderia gladioli]